MAAVIGGPSATGTDPSISSPPSRSTSTVSSSYAMGIISAAMSPNVSHGRLLGSGNLSDPAGLHVAVPSLSQAYAVPSSMQGQFPPPPPISSPPRPPPVTGHAHGSSLDYASFIETGPREDQSREEQGRSYPQRNFYPPASQAGSND
jgi:hypothetical protein